MIPSHLASGTRRSRRPARALVALAAIACAVALLVPGAAFAGQAATGELLFYPCTSCHPNTADRSALPNGFPGHDIRLVAHDALGRGRQACLACHDGPGRDPSRLITATGFVDIRGDVARVCYRCHSDKYKELKAGTHGKHQAKCTAAGCHDPHTPGWFYAKPTLPFAGSGFQVKALSGRQRFAALAGPAPAPPVDTPAWFSAIAAIGLFGAAVLAGALVRGRLKR